MVMLISSAAASPQGLNSTKMCAIRCCCFENSCGKSWFISEAEPSLRWSGQSQVLPLIIQYLLQQLKCDYVGPTQSYLLKNNQNQLLILIFMVNETRIHK